jgi:hypothetical protein
VRPPVAHVAPSWPGGDSVGVREGVGGGVVGRWGVGSVFGLPGSGFRLPETQEGNGRGG